MRASLMNRREVIAGEPGADVDSDLVVAGRRLEPRAGLALLYSGDAACSARVGVYP